MALCSYPEPLLDAVLRVLDAEERLRASGHLDALIRLHETLDAWGRRDISTAEAIRVVEQLAPPGDGAARSGKS